jgi:hypothetical protein
MKTILFIFLLFSIQKSFSQSTYINLQFEKNTLGKENLKGRIKTITERGWYAKERRGQFVKTKLDYWSISRYDLPGNEILNSEWDTDGENAGDTTNTSYGYIYDSLGNITEVYEKMPPSDTGFVIKSDFKYDSSNKNIEEDDYDFNLGPPRKSIFKYDSDGNLISNEYYEKGDKLCEKTLFQYNKGKMSKVIYYYPINTLNYILTFRHDKGGNLIGNTDYFNHKKRSNVNITKYDLQGDMIELNQYNVKGTMVGTSLKYKYAYDKMGNWIKEIYYENNKPKISERIIKYY